MPSNLGIVASGYAEPSGGGGGGPIAGHTTTKYAGVVDTAAGSSTAEPMSGTTGALSFTAGSLVLVGVGAATGNDGCNGFTVTSSGWTFTSRVKTPDATAGSFRPMAQWFTAVTPSTGSHTLTIITTQTSGERAFNLHAVVFELTGADTTDFDNFVANNATTPTDGALTVTLPSAPASTSVVFSMVSLDTDAGGTKNITPGSGYTEVADIFSATTYYGETAVEYRTASTATSAGFADLLAGSGYGVYAQGHAAIEIVEATGGGGGGGGLFATTVDASDRFLLDQDNDPWFGIGDTAWSMTAQLTTTQITTYLEDRADKGVNLVLINAPEPYFSDQTPKYRNQAGEDPFSGNNFETSFNEDYWVVVDHAIDEAERLGITMLICPFYLGTGSEGWASQITDLPLSNAEMTSYGNTLATRYGSAPNIIWLLGHDKIPNATEQARLSALFAALASGTNHLVAVGSLQDAGTPAQGYGSYAWDSSAIPYDIDTDYSYAQTPAASTATAWAFSPARPVFGFEYNYEQEQSFAGTLGDEPLLRYQLWGPLCAGACGVLFGNNPIWNFEASNAIYSYTGTWTSNLDSPGSLKLEMLAAFVAEHGAAAILAMLPDTTDTFLTAGEGSGTTRAVARFNSTGTSGLLAVAYRPHGGATSLTFDMSEFDATSILIRKFDPSAGTYSTVGTYANTGTQSVGSFGTNAAGDGDFVIAFQTP